MAAGIASLFGSGSECGVGFSVSQTDKREMAAESPPQFEISRKDDNEFQAAVT
jgi:hypothetical protein